ncbi:MAG: hypothetical protein DRP74_06760 [Candidatus Omnitrophota bacterium]|nr:MAG: hypothetical protein DRP74_06760 [Candidatus Omnitrophota bacterium]
MDLVNILWVALPLLIMVIVIVVIYYYTCGFRQSCRRLPYETSKKYLLFFLLFFGIGFSVAILIDFWLWADLMATPRYLWDRVYLPTLIASLIASGIALLGIKLLNR